LENCDSAVFFTVPFFVQKKSDSVSVNSLVSTIARMRVSGVTLMRFTMGLPRVLRASCGSSCTLSQKQRPSSVKMSMYVCVLAT